MLQLKDATYDTAGEYICDVTVPSLPALHTHGSVHIIVQGPSSFPLNFLITEVKCVFNILVCVCVCRCSSDSGDGAGGADGGGSGQDGEPEL